MFYLSNGRGFRLQFENGYILSVMFSRGHYCESTEPPYGLQSPDAEVTILTKDGKKVTRGVYKVMKDVKLFDNVVGWVTVREVAEVISFLNSFESGSETEKQILLAEGIL